ncbi:alpha/beta hydrolase [Oxalobacteraceae bacterium OTU3CINTB1]|nr:alpha/beta hydrolase [Oxalobacteraceae bacterium OTU3CINTB1]
MSPSTLFPSMLLLLRAMLLACTLAAASAAMAETKSYTITAPDGVTLAVRESGDPQGAPVIFIHGLLGSTLNWEAQVADPRLQRYRLISYDMRGHGLSGKPAVAEAYSDGRRWADDLRAVITSSRADRPVLVGWSLGGAVITNYLAAYGDGAIAGAVYVDGVIELKPEQIVAHPEVYRDLNAPDLKTHLDAVRAFLRLCFHTQPAASDFERLLANAAVASWDMQRAVQSMKVDLAGGLGKAKVPVLLIYGAQDALVKARPSIARAAEVNPRIRSVLYDASGHAPFIEETDRFNRDLSSFIDSLKR